MNKLDEKLIKKMDKNLKKIEVKFEEPLKDAVVSPFEVKPFEYDPVNDTYDPFFTPTMDDEEFDPFEPCECEPLDFEDFEEPFVPSEVIDELFQEGMTPFPELDTTVEEFVDLVTKGIVERFKEEGYFSKDGKIHIVTDADDDTEEDNEEVLYACDSKYPETRPENKRKENELLTTDDIHPYVNVDNIILCSEDITAFEIKTERPNGVHGKMYVYMTYNPHCMDHNIEKYATGKYDVCVSIANGKCRELGEFNVERFNMRLGFSDNIIYDIKLVKNL